jgi:hypothetical protein
MNRDQAIHEHSLIIDGHGMARQSISIMKGEVKGPDRKQSFVKE